jgi:ribosomal protein L40E
MGAEQRRLAGNRTSRPSICPKCGELLDADALACQNCGRIVPDPGRRNAEWLRRGVIALFILGAVAIAGSMIVSAIRSMM